jgi:hypothetical protein
VDVFLRKAYSTTALAAAAGRESDRLDNMFAQMSLLAKTLLRDQKGIGVAVAGLGAWELWRRDRNLAWAILINMLLGLPAFLWLANAPPTHFFEYVLLRLHGGRIVMFTLCSAAGLAALHARARRRNLSPAFVGVLAAVLPLAMLRTNFAFCNRSHYHYTENMARLVLNSVEPNSVVISCYDTMRFSLQAMRDAEGLRPDVVLASFAPARAEADQLRRSLPELGLPQSEGMTFSQKLIERAAVRRPVYLTFANQCNSQDIPKDIQKHILPTGLVYRWVPTPNKDLYLVAAGKGLALLATQPRILDEDASNEWDAGIQEVLHWYADAYLNIGIVYDLFGDNVRARHCRRAADLILN